MSVFLSIEFDEGSIKIVEAEKKGDLVSLLKCFTLDISFLIKEVKHNELDNITICIRDELLKHKIKTKKAIFVINSESIISRKLRLPLLKKKSETLSMIRYELEQVLPVDLDSYNTIYKISDTFIDDSIIKAYYIVYCFPKSLFNQYVKLAHNLNLSLVYIDISYNCLNKISQHNLIINSSPLDINNIYSFLKLESNTISFNILNNGVNDFSQIKTIYENNYYNQLVAESEFDYNINNSETSYESFNINNSILEEVSRYIRYYYSINNSNYIHKIFIYGHYKYMTKLIDVLRNNLNIEVSEIISLSNINYDNMTVCENFKLSKYFNSILALFSDKNDICYLPDSNIKGKITNRFNSSFYYTGLVIFVITLSSSIYIVKTFKDMFNSMELFICNNENIGLNQYIEVLKSENSQMQEILSEAIELDKIISSNAYVSSELIKEIFAVVPENTKVTSMNVDRNNAQLTCISSSMEGVTLFIYNLRKIEFIEKIYLPAIETNKDDLSYSCTIMCKLKDVNENVK